MITTLDITEFTPTSDKLIYDVRDAKSYAQAHLTHAINQPLATLNQALLEQSTGDIYVLCGGGTKAEKACQLLNELDPTRTYIHLIGGTRKAIAHDLPITKI